MALKSQRHGFFENYSEGKVDKDLRKPTYVNVGGMGDCGFRSVAAGIIDNFLAHPHLNPELLAKVLARHFTYFPSHRIAIPGLVTPGERMHYMIQQIRMGELVQSLAYTLRQIAVDALCANPELYPGAFVGEAQQEKVSPEYMRRPATYIDESSIAALAETLKMPIKVRMVEAGKELPLSFCYSQESMNPATNPEVGIRLKNQHYVPLVYAPDRFTQVAARPAQMLKPSTVADSKVCDPDLAAILVRVEEENKRLVSDFESTKNLLNAMVNAGELTKNDLLDLYIKKRTQSDYLKGRMHAAGKEHYGTQRIFEVISRATTPEVVAPFLGGHDKLVTDELVHAIARAISIGDMTAEEVFTNLDEKGKDPNQGVSRLRSV